MAATSESPAPETVAFDPATAAIVVVTYNRSALLERLLQSIARMDPKPGRVVIVDNASSDGTGETVAGYADNLGPEILYRRLETNTGGSGGFSEGMRVAYESGATWMWLMDDDVELIPDGLAKMGKWAPRFRSIQGRRYDYDGSEFYWQYRLSVPLGIPIPFAPAHFDASGYREMNSGCFEGMFIRRDTVRRNRGIMQYYRSVSTVRFPSSWQDRRRSHQESSSISSRLTPRDRVASPPNTTTTLSLSADALSTSTVGSGRAMARLSSSGEAAFAANAPATTASGNDSPEAIAKLLVAIPRSRLLSATSAADS